MNGVQKALQRARRRSSLSSSKLFFGNGLSTIFDKDRKLIYGLSGRFASSLSLVYYEHTPKPNLQVSRPQMFVAMNTRSTDSFWTASSFTLIINYYKAVCDLMFPLWSIRPRSFRWSIPTHGAV
jgi:hypothetical protein